MSNKIKNSNLFLRIFTITVLISLFSFLGLSLPNYAYGDSKEGKVIAGAEEDLNEVDDDVDVEDDLNEVDDDIDVEDDLNEVDDDIDADVTNTEETKNTNSNLGAADDNLKVNKAKNANGGLGTAAGAFSEDKKAKETKSIDDSLEVNSAVSDPISEVEVNQQLEAKEIVKLFFKNITLFFINLWDKIM